MIGEDIHAWARQQSAKAELDKALEIRARFEARVAHDIAELDARFEESKRVYEKCYFEEIEKMHFEHRAALLEDAAKRMQEMDRKISEFMTEFGMSA